MTQTKIGIIGGGIAGVSAAYYLAQKLGGEHVVLVEAESQLAQHTTGRSAAILIENYGAVPVRALTKVGLSFLRQTPADLADRPILTQRGSLFVATPDEDDEVEQLIAEASQLNVKQHELSTDEAIALCPMLRPGVHSRALYEPDAADIDVAVLHQAFVRGFRSAGGTILTSTRITDISRTANGWRLGSTSEPLEVEIVINAAGAWGDVVAASAGIAPIGLTPLRRTVFMATSPFPNSENWPIVSSAEHGWYAKPDGHQFLCSPADETPSEPCDAKPEEIDIAIAIDRINAATTMGIRSVTSTWAGLRTFAPDRSLVVGPDPTDPNFFWLVGQGGTGIQTSPGTGQLVRDLVIDGRPGPAFDSVGLDLPSLLPDRLRT
jgi:D-arginine dehydrogenase